MSTFKILVFPKTQMMRVLKDESNWQEYSISTAKNGLGEKKNSFQTPRGKHLIRAKIGAGCQENMVFRGRRLTGECYSEKLRKAHPERQDWILTRILWLSGCEIGKNRLGKVDTMQRFVYIHGTPDNIEMGLPGSRGCIRMRNQDIIELFDYIPCYTFVEILD
jgi:L,D-transpeptidase YbiS